MATLMSVLLAAGGGADREPATGLPPWPALVVLGLVAVGMIAAFVAKATRGERNAIAQINRWAASHQLEVESVTRRQLRTGRFFFHTNVQRVYAIVVSDPNGARRDGLVRVGGGFMGSLTEKVDVEWT